MILKTNPDGTRIERWYETIIEYPSFKKRTRYRDVHVQDDETSFIGVKVLAEIQRVGYNYDSTANAN